jgi:hypothetical protein
MSVLIAAVGKVMGIGRSRGYRMPSYDCATADEHTAMVEWASNLLSISANANSVL